MLRTAHSTHLNKFNPTRTLRGNYNPESFVVTSLNWPLASILWTASPLLTISSLRIRTTPLPATVWRWNTPNRATSTAPWPSFRFCSRPIPTTRPATLWRPKLWPAPTASPMPRPCSPMASLPPGAPATCTPRAKWKPCWQNWASRTAGSRFCSHFDNRQLKIGNSFTRHPRHRPLHHSWKHLINLLRHMHGPGHNHLPLSLQISPQHGPSHALGTNPAHRSRSHLP